VQWPGLTKCHVSVRRLFAATICRPLSARLSCAQRAEGSTVQAHLAARGVVGKLGVVKGNVDYALHILLKLGADAVLGLVRLDRSHHLPPPHACGHRARERPQERAGPHGHDAHPR
jgi:hypothetical protein